MIETYDFWVLIKLNGKIYFLFSYTIQNFILISIIIRLIFLHKKNVYALFHWRLNAKFTEVFVQGSK